MTPDRTQIDVFLARVQAAPSLVSAPSLRALLVYLVEATLSGEAERLKGYAIGVDVFQRGPDFDPQTDPIVRVQAGRLRKALEQYYATEGARDELRFELPKGAYRVAFLSTRSQTPRMSYGRPRHWRLAGIVLGVLMVLVGAVAGIVALNRAELMTGAGQPGANPALMPSLPDTQITIAVLPLADQTQDTTHGDANAALARQLTGELSAALARVTSFWVVAPGSAARFDSSADPLVVNQKLGVAFVLSGSLQIDHGIRHAVINLVDAEHGHQVWGDKFEIDSAQGPLTIDPVVARILAEVRPRLFEAAKRNSRAAAPESLDAWELYLQAVWTPEDAPDTLASEQARIELMRRALVQNPDFGQAHAVLAEKLAFLTQFDPPSDTPGNRTEAQFHAVRAVTLAANDPDVMFNVALQAWQSGQMAEAARALRRTLDLDPNHVIGSYLIDALPYACAVPPPSVLDDLVARDAALSRNHPVRWVLLSWISMLAINRGDWDRALQAARDSEQIHTSPEGALRRAALLVRKGDTEGAIALIRAQRVAWPNLSPDHYASAVIGRRCANTPLAGFLGEFYGNLAKAYAAAS